MDALGVESLYTYASFSSPLAREEFKDTELGATRVSKRELEELWGKAEENPLVFIQGSITFGERMREMAMEMGCRRLVEIRNVDGNSSSAMDRNMGSLKTREVSHKQVGGITTGRWLVGLDMAWPAKFRSSRVKRSLKHILKTTKRGTVCDGNETQHSVSNGSNRIPPGKDCVWVRCHSVLQKGKEVIRRLASSELMDVYDIEEATQRRLKLFKERNGKESLSFIHQVPAKVLVMIGSLVVNEEARVEREKHPPKVVRQSELVESLQCKQEKKMEKEVTKDTVANIEKEEQPDVKAAKNDDAEVDVLQWDQWSVDNFNCPKDQPPKVCIPGTYSEHHKRLFGLLRTRLLYRCRRNAFRGFTRYLRLEYDAMNRQSWASEEVELVGPLLGKTITVKAPAWAFLGKKRLIAVRKRKRRNDQQRDGEKELCKDLKIGVDALERLNNSSWWGWDDGSTLFFWRWPRHHRKAIRDGQKVFLRRKELPHYFRKQVYPKEPEQAQKLKDKVRKPMQRRYIVPGEIQNLTGFFAVPKGKDDIRIVYDATKSGLNDAIWAPSFALPTIDSILRNADHQTWFGDIDLGEMFLNYFLDEDLRSYAGVDVREVNGSSAYERWERCLMGVKSSPHGCTRTFAWSEDIINGNRHDPLNPLRWDKVILNLPGDPSYSPERPWVYRWDSINQCLASFFGSYMDDIRTGANTERMCRATSRRVAAGVNYLGQQDAPRKRRAPSQTPGAWAGAMCLSKRESGLYVTCSQEKWERGKALIGNWHEKVVSQDNNQLDFVELEKGVGFLVHLSGTFPAIFPYFKGLYNTMNSWRIGRNPDGWKFKMKEWKSFLEMEEAKGEDVHRARKEFVEKKQGSRPKNVRVVPRCKNDLVALKELLEGDVPPHRLVRGYKIKMALYAFGDASGGGFGASWEVKEGIRYRFGTWGKDKDDESSNLRELANLADSLAAMAEEGTLEGVEVFFFTDNTTAEGAFFNGSSKAESLFKLVLEIKKLEMTHECKIHICHVAGTRMIEQGSDGLSRGNLTEGAMKGKPIRSFVPIHLGALERQIVTVEGWIRSWAGETVESLEPEGWFVRGQNIIEGDCEVNSEGRRLPKLKPGKFLWAPAPAAAGTAVEQLRKARQKCTMSSHIFLVPRLMQPLWRKQLYKASDIVLTIPPGHAIWPLSMHEPLILAILLPYIRFEPWELRRTPKILDLGELLSEVWRSGDGAERPILQELWMLQERVESMSQSLAWKMLFGKHRSCIPHREAGKRRRIPVEKEKGRKKISRR